MGLRTTNNPKEICFGIKKLQLGEWYDEDEAEYEFVTGFIVEETIEDYSIFGEELWRKLMKLDTSIVEFETSESVHIIRPGIFNTVEDAIEWIEKNTGFKHNPAMDYFCHD